MTSMSKQERNTEEIVRLAREKAIQTKERVERVLSRLALEGKIINFNTVSIEAGVSKSWLYKEPEIRKRINILRNQQENRPSKVSKQKNKKSLRSEEVLIKTLKERIKEVEEENSNLKIQVQKLLGELYSQN